jgi:UDP:flavonoid glycosyltransferase YjiC (YdhE family)
MVCSAFVDQPYWATRIRKLGLGPAPINTGKVSRAVLEERVAELLETFAYRRAAKIVAEQIRAENALDRTAALIEQENVPGTICGE